MPSLYFVFRQINGIVCNFIISLVILSHCYVDDHVKIKIQTGIKILKTFTVVIYMVRTDKYQTFRTTFAVLNGITLKTSAGLI